MIRPTAPSSRAWALKLAAGLVLALPAAAQAQISEENPSPMLQWFECRWSDMERRMSDYFIAGYGSVWVPPISRAYTPPTQLNQHSTSAGYDTFDRFDLGKPGATTAYGTEASFGSVVDEFHRAGAQIYIDIVLNHNAGRQTGVTFQQEGGYPGFWMNSTFPVTTKQPTDNWGDFHNGIAGGYYQSENPGGARYCLHKGDLVALVDINHGSVNNFIRQPTTPGNPLNIPGGTYFNIPSAENARFYPDSALGTNTINNPGMWFAGALTTGIFAAPCEVPARNEPASQLTLGQFNSANPLAGDPVAENATGYLLRWVQWMLDVHEVDGFRIDAIKHMPSWFYDTYFDTVVFQRRTTPDGRAVTPYSFGESVEGNDFTFDRYVRKPNGRASGRLVAGDAYGNRDCLDLNGAGAIRNIIGSGGVGSWNNIIGAHLDNTDDGFNNGSVGVNHIFSHDNGSAGDGGSAPPFPTAKQQGYYAHAYLFMRTGQAKVFHNARGISRTGSGFYPRQGVVPALGVDYVTNSLNPTIVNLVQLSNWYGRGEFTPRSQDADVLVFERRTNLGGGGYSGNVLVGCNDRYDAGFDSRSISTSFPAGTRLIEMTGNAANATVDPAGDIFDVITVGAGGAVTIRVPRNASGTGEHNKGFVVYGPAIPSGTLALTNVVSSLPAESTSVVPASRRRLNAVPVISANSFQIQLTTTNGDAGAANNDNADDNALFRINAGYQDWNASGGFDIPSTHPVTPGYEEFTTLRQPLANTANTNGLYHQTIDSTLLEEGMNYIAVAAFRKRNLNEAPLFREFRQPIYIDRFDPTATLLDQGPLPENTIQFKFHARALDRTVNRIHLLLNPAPTGTPLLLASAANQATIDDRFDHSRTLTGLSPGPNTVLLLAFEESGRGIAQYYTVIVSTCGSPDFDGDGDSGTDLDIEAFFACLGGDCCATCGSADFDADGDSGTDLDIEAFFRVLGGGNC